MSPSSLYETLLVRVVADLVYESSGPTPMLFVVRPRERYTHVVVEERRSVDPDVPVEEYVDSFGNFVWRVVAPEGPLRVAYDAVVDLPAEVDPAHLDLPKTPIEALPHEVLQFILPSRYCQSDVLVSDAWELFGGVSGGWAQVQAVSDWIHTNVEYGKGSTSATSSLDVWRERRGVCRDFAHMGVTLCRALNFPARYVCGYLPDIWVPPDPLPMDFPAWFEVFLGGAWRTFDARHNRPRVGRVLVAAGRDAADVALTTIFGSSPLTSMRVWADEVAGDFEL
jgi:transglutaminase-like putative cysteine protease